MKYTIEIPTVQFETMRMLSMNDDLDVQLDNMRKRVFEFAKKFLFIIGDDTDITAMQLSTDQKNRQMLAIETQKPSHDKKKRKRGGTVKNLKGIPAG
jgi:hypothetical protein